MTGFDFNKKIHTTFNERSASMSTSPNSALHIFWTCGDYDWDNALMSTGKAGARMYRLHDQITVEAVHYDHEDNREYYSQGKFSVESYKKAFQEMGPERKNCRRR